MQAALELALPGGSLIALALWTARHYPDVHPPLAARPGAHDRLRRRFRYGAALNVYTSLDPVFS